MQCRFVTVCGDGEYIIYTALAWRNKSFGAGSGFAWAADSNTYAIRDSTNSKVSPIKVFRNFKERPGLIKGISYTASSLWGGALLGVKGNGFVCFYDWENGALVRRIEVDANNVSWQAYNEQAVHEAEMTNITVRSSGRQTVLWSPSRQQIRSTFSALHEKRTLISSTMAAI